MYRAILVINEMLVDFCCLLMNFLGASGGN